MRIVTWHVHAAWSSALVSGRHRYLIPTLPDRGPYGRGRPMTFPWPDNAIEISPEGLRVADVDVAVLQRPEEEDLLHRWLGRRVPLIYVEHNTPKNGVPGTRHPMADRDDVIVVHVTHFNDLFWDCGHTRTVVIEPGVRPPNPHWTGELERLAVVTNEPVRRGRTTGTDLFARFAEVAPLDIFGTGVSSLGNARIAVHEDLSQPAMHIALTRRRAYLHLTRWTSLGLSLIEAMLMGCPVIALATTEAPMAVPPGCGHIGTNVTDLVEAARVYLKNPDVASSDGSRARAFAVARFGLSRFLADWDDLLALVGPGQHPTGVPS
jgi:hypothetical protein